MIFDKATAPSYGNNLNHSNSERFLVLHTQFNVININFDLTLIKLHSQLMLITIDIKS